MDNKKQIEEMLAADRAKNLLAKKEAASRQEAEAQLVRKQEVVRIELHKQVHEQERKLREEEAQLKLAREIEATSLEQQRNLTQEADAKRTREKEAACEEQQRREQEEVEARMLEEQIWAESEVKAKPVSYADLKAKKRKRTVSDENEARDPSTNVQVNNMTSSSSRILGAGPSTMPESTVAPKNPFGPERKPWKKNNVVYISKEVIDLPKKLLPAWYTDTNMKEKHSRTEIQTISYVRTIIQNCIAESRKMAEFSNSEKLFSELRSQVQRLEFYQLLSKVVIKKSKILEDGGLVQIFEGPDRAIFPWDIRADAEALYLRWMGGDFDGSLLRGIKPEKGVMSSGAKRTSHKIDKDFQKKSPNVVGSNDLINGQWWPSRLCAFRDGAHGELEAGIHGQRGKGAYSIVVAAGGYADNDYGDVIEYCGTANEMSTPSKHTLLLEEAYANGQPLRVLRATKRDSVYAPRKGIRYDGLYRITGKEILDTNTAMFRYTFERIRGQDPIRYQGVEARPNDEEMREATKIRDLLASMG